jgi:para-aminobenzoate synthetase component 1
MSNLLHLHRFTVKTDDLLEVFAPLSHRPWSILLDSGSSEHFDAKFDIAVFSPRIKLIFDAGHAKAFDENDTLIDTPSDPFEALRALSKQYLPLIKDETLPFTGGWVGHFSYDLGRQIEQLPTHAIKDIQLPDVALGLYDRGIIREKKSGQITGFGWSKAALNDVIDKVENAVTYNLLENNCFTLTSAWQSNMSEAEYQQKFTKVQNYLRSGDCYQINLAQRFKANYRGDEWHAFLQLRNANHAPFSAFMRLPDNVILSLSPERLLKLCDNKIQTKPIKGTRRRHIDARLDQAAIDALQHADKDRAENLMIVDLLRNDLSKVAKVGSVKVPKLFAIESFAAVHHLVSTIEAELADNTDQFALLRAVFPGGSITGAPKVRAMEIIEELEPHRRSLYCGAIGYISSSGQMDTNIAIRTLICENNEIFCWGGGGLVADSDVYAEYQETKDKLATILPILSK